MKIIKVLIFCFLLIITTNANSDNKNFNEWIKSFKIIALKNDISENTFEQVMELSLIHI